MSAIVYLLQTFLGLLLSVFLLRVLLPLVQADARNPFSQAVIRLTNPLVLPLRRIVPAIGRLDTAALIALIFMQVAATALLIMIGSHIVSGPIIFVTAAFDLIELVLQFYKWATIMYVLLSWVAPDTYSPVSAILNSLVTPVVRPWRKLIPPFGGMDLSPALLVIAIQALLLLLDEAHKRWVLFF
jgi:YggT family protein